MIKKLIARMLNNHGGEDTKQPDIRLQRTLTNTVFEIVIGVLLLVLWVSIAFKIAMSEGKSIPIHFDMGGHPDDYGSPYWMLLGGAIGTIFAIHFMIAAYRPTKIINIKIRNMRQVGLLVYWLYVVTIEFILLCISLVYSTGDMINVFLNIMIFIMFATCMVFMVLLRIYK